MPSVDVWATAADVRTADRWHSASANWNSALTKALLDAANLQEDCLVMDVAAGSGDPALWIAKRLKNVKVLAIDRSFPSLVLAKRQSDAMGLGSKLRLVQADVRQLPFYDSCVERMTCRFGVMYFAEIDTAFTEMLRVLKPRGHAVFLAWGEFEQPFFESTVGVILRLIPGTEVPDPARTVFKFAARGSIEDALRRTGFRNVEERHIALPRIWSGSPQDLWQYFQEVSPPFQPLVDAIPANRRSEVNAAVCVSLARFQSGATITIPVRVVLATAEK
jgi:ubiquinone/menaquinone biosynthesis C-methylase UbiE